MDIFGVSVSPVAVIVGAVIIVGIIILIILAIISGRKVHEDVPDLDTRENFGDFHGLLTKEDFEVRADDHMLEVYRMQWIQAEPGDQKDNYLLLYLALKQLNKEQDESEDEWTQEQCEARMDEIIAELSEKTGLKPIVNELDESEFETYFASEAQENDGGEAEDGADADGESETDNEVGADDVEEKADVEGSDTNE